MKTGLLWYDDDPATTLEEKVRRLTKYYRRKYGFKPDTCHVHHSIFAGKKKKFVVVGDVTVSGSGAIQMGYFWAGCQDRETIAVVA